MTVYWDTSALLNAITSLAVRHRLEEGQNWTRLHTLCEAFSIMTGRGVPTDASGSVRATFTPEDCAAWLEQAAGNLSITELTRFEVLKGLKSAQRLAVRGRRIHDLMHAIAADRVKADVLLTRDQQDFAGLGKARVEWP